MRLTRRKIRSLKFVVLMHPMSVTQGLAFVKLYVNSVRVLGWRSAQCQPEKRAVSPSLLALPPVHRSPKTAPCADPDTVLAAGPRAVGGLGRRATRMRLRAARPRPSQRPETRGCSVRSQRPRCVERAARAASASARGRWRAHGRNEL